MSQESKALSVQQETYKNHRLAGRTAAESARLSGYSPAYAKKAARYLDSQPQIRAAIELEQGKLRDKGQYDLAAAVREADSMIAFAKEHRNPMAATKCLELKAKLHGLLVDKIHMQVETVDVSAVLMDARKRSTFHDRDAALKQIAHMRANGLISAADIAQVTGTVTDAEFTMVAAPVDPFSEAAS